MAKETATLSGIRLIWGFLLLMMCIFLLLSFYSYDWRDISHLKAPPISPPSNLIGLVGAWLAYIIFLLAGVGAYLVPLWCLVFGILMIFNKEDNLWMKLLWCALFMLGITCLLELHREFWNPTIEKINIPDAGGFISRTLTHTVLIKLLSKVGAGILLWTILTVSLTMFIGPANFAAAYRHIMAASTTASEKISTFIAEHQDKRSLIEKEERLIEKRRAKLEKTIRQSPRPEKLKPLITEPDIDEEEDEAPAPFQARTATEPKAEQPEEKPKRKLIDRIRGDKKPEPEPARPAPDRAPALRPADPDMKYELPPLSLLEVPAHSPRGDMQTDTDTAGRVLEETLLEFDIEAKVTHVETGPVVTRYELLPAPGIRIERISALTNNLALAMKASSIRVQAPIPGKGVVGIEIPNSVAKKVFLREILEGEVWNSGKAALPLVLGKDVGGNDLIADLAAMPHILIAGATGAGKTVCMNSILAGLLMARRPDEMKLMLVDPKIVEFGPYNDIPHLVVPVITKPKKVSLGLRWAINEMEKRYKLFAKVGVRNIESYNNREIVTQENLFGEEQGAQGEEQQQGPPRTVPYIVIVIDELADLMLADQAEIENCIARLAQLSRAVGIHMILSTQRPSVNVITGTIKANFPARIAFQVAQKVDSRTILDTVGADKLLGKGDMLFLPPGSSKLIRAQGALTSDKDISNITAFIKKQSQPAYVAEVHEQLEKKGSAAGMDDGSEDDDVMEQAVEIIRETKRASTSSLQRRLRIGYTRAARIMDILEERGIIGPPRGSDPREILIDLEGEIPNNDATEGVE